MPSPREIPIRFVPRGVTDTINGENSAPGSMVALTNLIYNPSTPGTFLCRPANTKQSIFPGISAPGVISAAYSVGNILYGLIGSSSPAGNDRPFAYNVATNSFLTVSGITSANTPVTQTTTGDWKPPTMDALGSKIIVTHPGFNFSGGYAFGYFDISGFSATIVGDVTSGSPTVNGSFSIAGVSPGYTISGTNIPANTTVVGISNVNISATGVTHTNTTVDSISPNTTGMFVGQQIAGLGIPGGTTIASIVSSSAITISQAATASATVAISVSGQTVTMSANATGSANTENIAIAGGTAAAPLWAAGNTTGQTQLAGIPQGVKQFNNRAWFAQKNNLVFTDTLSLNISNANGTQVLTIGDTTDVVALAGLPEYTTSIGVLQALLAFKNYSIWQITGDAALQSLSLNEVIGTIGTDAPRSVQTTPQGVTFKALDGIRNVDLSGGVSEVDLDLSTPFIYAQNPSRVASCFNAGVYRICTHNAYKTGAPFEDYHYTYKIQAWTGPHSFRYSLAVAYANDFIVFSDNLPGTMWYAYSVQNHDASGNTFIENGVQLTWVYQTSSMTYAGNMYANAVVRTTMEFLSPSNGDVYTFQALNESNSVLAQAFVSTPFSEAIWNSFNWGDGILWGSNLTGLIPRIIPWTQPPIFNRLAVRAMGNSALGLIVGALYNGYERLNYLRST